MNIYRSIDRFKLMKFNVRNTINSARVIKPVNNKLNNVVIEKGKQLNLKQRKV